MLKKGLLALAVLLVGLVLVVATRPSTFRVERSITMAAPADIPFALVNDFHRWRFWSPWEALDPQLQRSFEGAHAGTGAIYAWSGNEKVGKGKMTLLESRPHESVRIQLQFIEPWEGTSTLAFTFQPTAEGVTVRWSMEGENNFVAKAFSLFMDMEALIGGDYEKGLASLKSLSEAEAKNRAEQESRRKAEEAAELAKAGEAAQAPEPTGAPQAHTTP